MLGYGIHYKRGYISDTTPRCECKVKACIGRAVKTISNLPWMACKARSNHGDFMTEVLLVPDFGCRFIPLVGGCCYVKDEPSMVSDDCSL